MKCHALALLGHQSVLCNFPLQKRVLTSTGPSRPCSASHVSLGLSAGLGLEQMFNESLLDRWIEKLTKGGGYLLKYISLTKDILSCSQTLSLSPLWLVIAFSSDIPPTSLAAH